MSEDVRVRFAPSPTGYLHVGGARTALFNHLFARHHGGRFILRIEDTDRKRFQQAALEEIFHSLEWLGLEWDEGPDRGGDLGPYFQSERRDLYEKHARELIENDLAYPCFCTPERLQALRKAQEKTQGASVSGYDRLCRDLTPEERARRMGENRSYVVRFKIPEGRRIPFHDMIRGDILYESDVLDDFVILKSDGFPTYHLANVVDDHLMNITHIMRGDEWISSAPRHVLLYEAFGWEAPALAHLPVILAPGGGKLSKRHGAASVMDYRRRGILPQALVNFLVLLGWAPGGDTELMTREEMVERFTLDRVTAKASVFDEEKLDWMNGQYLRRENVATLRGPVVQRLKEKGVIENDIEESYMNRVILLLRERSRRITDIADQAEYFFHDPASYDPHAARKHFREDTAGRLEHLVHRLDTLPDFTADSLEDLYRTTAESLNLSAGKLIHPTRLAISGVPAGPGLFELMEVLARDRVVRRLRRAIVWMNDKENEDRGA